MNYNCYEGSVNGTVEIYYDDGVHGPQWGYMCESYALKFTAEVVCRQLGYSDGNLNQHEVHSHENEGQILRQTTTNRVQVGRHNMDFISIFMCIMALPMHGALYR